VIGSAACCTEQPSDLKKGMYYRRYSISKNILRPYIYNQEVPGSILDKQFDDFAHCLKCLKLNNFFNLIVCPQKQFFLAGGERQGW
jgi:hypothetical protein